MRDTRVSEAELSGDGKTTFYDATFMINGGIEHFHVHAVPDDTHSRAKAWTRKKYAELVKKYGSENVSYDGLVDRDAADSRKTSEVGLASPKNLMPSIA